MCHFVANYLEVIGLVASGHLTSQTPLDVTNSHHESIDATCTSPRLEFTDLGSGLDLRGPPLPSSVTIMTTQNAEERCHDMGV